MSKIKGEFQIGIFLKEFVETPDSIEIHTIVDYLESCWDFEDVKKTIKFFIKRIEGKLNGEK